MSDQQLFRSAMSRLSAAVSIIATDGPAGRYGMTASSVCSVSDDPPTVLVCVNRNARSNIIFRANGNLSISILAIGQDAVSSRFASGKLTVDERFGSDSDWATRSTGAPLLVDALASLDCTVSHIQEVATHSVFFCHVESIVLGESRKGLVYFDRGYHETLALTAFGGGAA